MKSKNCKSLIIGAGLLCITVALTSLFTTKDNSSNIIINYNRELVQENITDNNEGVRVEDGNINERSTKLLPIPGSSESVVLEAM